MGPAAIGHEKEKQSTDMQRQSSPTNGKATLRIRVAMAAMEWLSAVMIGNGTATRRVQKIYLKEKEKRKWLH